MHYECFSMRPPIIETFIVSLDNFVREPALVARFGVPDQQVENNWATRWGLCFQKRLGIQGSFSLFIFNVNIRFYVLFYLFIIWKHDLEDKVQKTPYYLFNLIWTLTKKILNLIAVIHEKDPAESLKSIRSFCYKLLCV